jgi:hypothetical protein
VDMRSRRWYDVVSCSRKKKVELQDYIVPSISDSLMSPWLNLSFQFLNALDLDSKSISDRLLETNIQQYFDYFD